MKKKCLGCGKVFEDRLSICQDCFNAVEHARNSVTLPKNFSLLEWRVNRYVMLGGLLVISGLLVFGLCTAVLFLGKHLSLDYIVFLFYPAVFGPGLSFFVGTELARGSMARVVRNWQDQAFFTLRLRERWRYPGHRFLLWLFWSVIKVGALWLAMFLFMYAEPRLFCSRLPAVLPKSIWIIRMSLAAFCVNLGFLLGVFRGLFLYSDWISKLSK